MATRPTFLLIRAVGGGLGFKSSPDGDSISFLKSFTAVLHPIWRQQAEEGVFLLAPYFLAAARGQFLPWSGAFRRPEGVPRDQIADQRHRCCPSPGNRPFRIRQRF